MASRNARLTFAPDPQLHADVMTIARLTGEPSSKVLAKAVSLIGPLFHEMAANLLRIEAAELEAERHWTRFTGDYRSKLEPYVAGLARAAIEAENMALRLEGTRPIAKRAKHDAKRR